MERRRKSIASFVDSGISGSCEQDGIKAVAVSCKFKNNTQDICILVFQTTWSILSHQRPYRIKQVTRGISHDAATGYQKKKTNNHFSTSLGGLNDHDPPIFRAPIHSLVVKCHSDMPNPPLVRSFMEPCGIAPFLARFEMRWNAVSLYMSRPKCP